MKEIISPVTSFLQARKTPFFTTYIYVWIIRNWNFIIDLYYNKTKDDLIKIIKNEYPTWWCFFWEIFLNVFFTLLLVAFTFFALACARVLTDCYQFTVVPYIRRKLDKIGSTHILKESIQPLKDELENYKIDLEYERQSNVRLTKKNKELENQIVQKHDELIKLSEKNIIDSAEFGNRNKAKVFKGLQHEIELLKTNEVELNKKLNRYVDYQSKEIAAKIAKSKTALALLEYSRLDPPFIIKDYQSNIYNHLIFNKLIVESETSAHGKKILLGRLTELGILVAKELQGDSKP